jgi:hypothetical protein
VEFAKIVALGLFAAIGYGVIHDQAAGTVEELCLSLAQQRIDRRYRGKHQLDPAQVREYATKALIADLGGSGRSVRTLALFFHR